MRTGWILLIALAVPGCKPESRQYRQIVEPAVNALIKLRADTEHGTTAKAFGADRTAAGTALQQAKDRLSIWDRKRVSFGALTMSLEGYKQVAIIGTRPDKASSDFVKLGDDQLDNARQLLLQGK